MAENCLSEPEKLFIVHGINKGIRSDGRSCEDFRPMKLETEVLPSCSGSARIRLANTDVLVGVKCEVGEPAIVKPNQGVLHFFVDCSANATPMFEGRGGDEFGNLISRCLAEAYEFSGALDLPSLCLIPSVKCWHLYVDILLLEVGGNVLDATAIAVKAALQQTMICGVDVVQGDGCNAELQISDDPYNVVPLNATKCPLFVTSYKIGATELVDASLDEEDCSNAKLLVGVSVSGDCCLMRKLGPASLHPDTIENMLHLSCRIGSRLHQRLAETFQSTNHNSSFSQSTNPYPPCLYSFKNIGFLRNL